jgi:hypothetical protein
MKDAADKVVFALYGVFGGFLGLLIFMFALGGWSFVFTGEASRPWNGLVALIISCVLGGGWGLVAYKHSDVDLGSGALAFLGESGTAILFVKRVMVICTCLAGAYFIWQLARGL